MSLSSRDQYIGHPDDENFEDTITQILSYDDVNKLHDYLKVYGDDYHYPAFLDICLDLRAKQCALYIMEGNLPHGPPILSCDHLEPKPVVPVLYQVILFICEPHVFDLLLTHCKAGNQANQPYVGLLPLHWLLDLLLDIPPLSDWSPAQPLSIVIDSLFLPEIRPKLECVRLLAQHTHSLDQIALDFIQHGEIIYLAALLLVAPFTKADFETIKSAYTSIASQAIHDQSFTPSTYCATAALLHIFDKYGHNLTSKFNNLQKGIVQAGDGDESVVNDLIQQEHEPVGVIAEVATRIQHTQIQVLSTYVDLTDIYSASSHSETLKSICERLGVKIDDTTQISRKSLFPSVQSVKERGRIRVPVWCDDPMKS